MFKAQVLVHADTDVAAELAAIEKLAAKQNLDAMKLHVLLQGAENVISELKRQGSETASHGISLTLEKNLTSDDYQLSFRFASSRGGKKRGLLSWLSGR